MLNSFHNKNKTEKKKEIKTRKKIEYHKINFDENLKVYKQIGLTSKKIIKEASDKNIIRQKKDAKD